MTTITVWQRNDSTRRLEIEWKDALDAFAQSFYAGPKSLPMSIEERVHLFMESNYRTFVAPDSRDANGQPSLSAEDYKRFMQEAARRLN